MAAYRYDSQAVFDSRQIYDVRNWGEQKWWNQLLAFSSRGKFLQDGSFSSFGGPMTGLQILQDLPVSAMGFFWNQVVNDSSWKASIIANQERNTNKLGDMDQISIQTIDWVFKNKHGVEKASFATVLADFLVNNSLIEITSLSAQSKHKTQEQSWKTSSGGQGGLSGDPYMTIAGDSAEIIGYAKSNGKIKKEDLLAILTGGTVNDMPIDRFDTQTGGTNGDPAKNVETDSDGNKIGQGDGVLNEEEQAAYNTANNASKSFSLQTQANVAKIMGAIILGYLGHSKADAVDSYQGSAGITVTEGQGVATSTNYTPTPGGSAAVNVTKFDANTYDVSMSGQSIRHGGYYISEEKQIKEFRKTMKLTGGMMEKAITWGHGYMIAPAKLALKTTVDHTGKRYTNQTDGSGFETEAQKIIIEGGLGLGTSDPGATEAAAKLVNTFLDHDRINMLYDAIKGYTQERSTPPPSGVEVIFPRKGEHLWGKIPEFIRSALPFETIDTSTDGTRGDSDKFEDLAKKTNDLLANMKDNFTPTSITGAPATVTAKRKKFFNNILQCILLAGTPSLQVLSDTLRSPYPYGGRVIPVDIKEQENFVNALTLPSFQPAKVSKENYKSRQTNSATINDYLQSTKFFNSTVVTKVGLYKVIKNYHWNGKLKNEGRPIAFPLNFKVGWPVPNFRDRNPVAVFQGGTHKDVLEGTKPEFIQLKSIDIEFKGGTIATAKSDVECKITFELQDISFIEQAFQYRVNLGDNDKDPILYKFTFLDLISYTNKNNTGTGFASSLRQQYHPDYNRLLLKANVKHQEVPGKIRVKNWQKINDVLETVPMILDLALVDHTIDKSELNRSATVTINYRGWVDSILSDPSQDTLASKEVFKNRIFREIATRKLVNAGCNYDQIKNFYAETAEEAKAESAKTMSDLIKRLDLRNKLFKMYIDSDTVERSLSADQSYIQDGSVINAKMGKIVTQFDYEQFGSVTNKTLERLAKKQEGLAKGGKNSSVTDVELDGVCLYHDIWKNAYDATDKKAAEKLKKSRAAILNKKNIAINFFFLGDLFEALLDNQYQEMNSLLGLMAADRPLSIEFAKDFTDTESADGTYGGGYYFNIDPVKIILPTFEWTYPDLTLSSSQHKKIRTNIADIPVSLEWFTDWFRREVIDKNLTYYPVGTFVKSVSHTIVSRLINEICFGLVSEQKVLFKARHDVGIFSGDYDSKRKDNLHFRENNEFGFNTKWVHGPRIPRVLSALDYFNFPTFSYEKWEGNDGSKNFPLLKKEYDANPDEYCNFIIVYPANTNSFSKFANGKTDGSGIPHFNFKRTVYNFVEGSDLAKVEKTNLISKIKFSKTEAKYRRESRFFSSNMGSLAQIAGVYNATMTFHKPVFFLYPGQLCWIDAGLKDRPNGGKESIAFILGLGGYHQIVNVKHSFKFKKGQLVSAGSVVEAYWVNHGSLNKMHEKMRHGKIKEQEEKLSQACADAYADLPDLAKKWLKSKVETKKTENKKKKKATGSATQSKTPTSTKKPNKSTRRKSSRKRRSSRKKAEKKQAVIAMQSDPEELARIEKEQEIRMLTESTTGTKDQSGESPAVMSESEMIAASAQEAVNIDTDLDKIRQKKIEAEKAEKARLDKMQAEAEALQKAQQKAEEEALKQQAAASGMTPGV